MQSSRKAFTIPVGNLDASQESLFSGQLPRRIVIGCVDNDAFSGLYGKNPFHFKYMNLSQLKVYLDGQPHSVKPLETTLRRVSTSTHTPHCLRESESGKRT